MISPSACGVADRARGARIQQREGWAHTSTNGCGRGASDERVTYEQQEVTGRDAPYPGGYESLQVPRSGYGARERRSDGLASPELEARCPAPVSSQDMAEVGELRER